MPQHDGLLAIGPGRDQVERHARQQLLNALEIAARVQRQRRVAREARR